MKLLRDVNAKNLKDLAQYVIIYILVGGMLLLIYKLFTIKFPMENKEIGLLLIGTFSAKFSDSIGFLLNSSKGSAEKSEVIAKLPPLPDDNVPTLKN